MRTQHHNPTHRHQLILLSPAGLINCLIIFNDLLLNAQQAAARTGDGAKSCYSTTNTTCSPKLKSKITFPFLTTSPECSEDSNSSFVITGCTSASASANGWPKWPAFKSASSSSSSKGQPPFVMAFFNPFDAPANQTRPRATNGSNQLRNRFQLGYGFINLTWDDSLMKQTGCKNATLDQISQSIPNTIDLHSFAHSAFQFSLSNIILLFNCDSAAVNSSSYREVLHKNTTACRSYGFDCNLHEKEKDDCYQYIPYKTLYLPDAMKQSKCTHAMFFSVPNITLVNASQWSANLIELNWSTNSTGKGWLASTLDTCIGCLQTKGACGYDTGDHFQCFGANNSLSATNSTEPNAESKTHTHHHILIVIITVAGSFLALSILLALLALFCLCRRRKVSAKVNVPCSSPHDKSWMKRPSFLSRKQDPICAKEISYEELVCATDSFAEKHMLGDGAFGAVYQGVLADGRKVAIKRLHHDNYRRMEHFYNEIKALSNLSHPNLVKLYGFCCDDERELLLVFEYAQHGTVSDKLHNKLTPPMSWKLRLDIACETADALSYLHNSVNPPIYHRDVKTTNILLDEGFRAKLADFGLSKLVTLKATHVSTAPQGTPGYLDPEYHHSYRLTDKSDVYSLGVVLMELISAKLAVDMSREKGEINLSSLAIMKIQCGLLEELVDPALQMEKNPGVEKSIKRVVELAFQCLLPDRDDRPSMSSVAETLARIRRETAGDEAADEELLLPHTPTQAHSHSTHITRPHFVSDGPIIKPSPHPHSSPPSVFFSSDSSCPSSLE